MLSMNSRIFISAVAVVGAFAFADQSASEKGAAAAHTVGRKMNKAGHRVTEALCAKSDAKCLARKAKHRAQETGEYVKDKTSEMGDKMDSDSKAGE